MINLLLLAAIFLAIVFGTLAFIFASERVRLAIVSGVFILLAVVLIALGARIGAG